LFYHAQVASPQDPKVVWIRGIERDSHDVPSTFQTELGVLLPSVIFAQLNSAVGTGHVIRVDRGQGRYQLRYERPLLEYELLRLENILSVLWIMPFRRDLNFAMAVDWHRTPGGSDYTHIGHQVFMAKRRHDPNARAEVARQVAGRAARHAAMAQSQAVVAAPSSGLLVRAIADEVGRLLGVPVYECTKLDPAKMQIQADDASEGPIENTAAGNITLPETLFAARMPRKVLVVDDVYSTGNTIAEVARCLREAGVKSVYSVTATKTARHQRQT
jgi:adenine/guanine phosphoribosyltransferase-like PRPP-binding protein